MEAARDSNTIQSRNSRRLRPLTEDSFSSGKMQDDDNVNGRKIARTTKIRCDDTLLVSVRFYSKKDRRKGFYAQLGLITRLERI